jgi:hypothetical protein
MSLVGTPLTISETLERLGHALGEQSLFERVLSAQPQVSSSSIAAFQDRPPQALPSLSILYPEQESHVPAPVAMRGVRLRVVLTQAEVEQGILGLEPALMALVPQQERDTIQWLDHEGQTLTVSPARLLEVRSSLGKTFSHTRAGVDVGNWLTALRARPGDSVLLTVVEWDPRCFSVELEPQRERQHREAEIGYRNLELADLLYALLEASPEGAIYVPDTIPTVYARLYDATGYPGDHWIQIVQDDSRMELLGTTITYAGCYSPLDRLFECLTSEGYELTTENEAYTDKPEPQVYRFRVSARDRPGLLQYIEIEGQQTLGHLDFALRDAFGHDAMAHTGSFRHVVAGGGELTNTVYLGDVDPFEGGSAADRTVGDLRLEANARLQYSLGPIGRFEHSVELEAVVAQDPTAYYPRVVDEGTPRVAQ